MIYNYDFCFFKRINYEGKIICFLVEEEIEGDINCLLCYF